MKDTVRVFIVISTFKYDFSDKIIRIEQKTKKVKLIGHGNRQKKLAPYLE